MQKLFLSVLALFARLIIGVHKPYIIGVTGTVGKTTISSHIASYLVHQFHTGMVMYSKYHYNGEFGLPLSIIGTKTGWRNPFRWIWIFSVAIFRLFTPYPKYVVLEYGIDHPGEMDFLMDIAIPDLVIVTEIVPNHIEQFGSLSAYRAEKLKIVNWPKMVILHDTLRPYVDKEAIYYGRWAMSDIDASHIEINEKWTHAVVHAYGKDYPLSLPVFWEFQIDNLLPLYALANALEIDLSNISHYARTFSPESWRSWILHGINNSIVIDGSYNGWYLSMHSGIVSMRSFLHSHKIVFLLGDMRELWVEEEKLHKQLANEIVELFPDDSDVDFVLVGPLMKKYIFPVLNEKFEVNHFYSSRNAGNFIGSKLQKSETPSMVYVKWSQNTIFLEEGIRQFLAQEEDISRLCRQSSEWMKKKELFFHSLKNS